MCYCRLKWAGLLPYARLVEGTRQQFIPQPGEEAHGQWEGVDSTRLRYDRSLLSCLVDRWRPETHTLHFPWGEMAPTLQDVAFLLGLPLAGEAIGPLDAPDDWASEMEQRFAGLRPGIEPFSYDKHGPSFGWLLEHQVRR